MKHSRFGNLFTALAAAALILGACAPAATPTAAPTTAPQPTTAPEPTVAPTTAPTPVTLHIMHNWADTDPKGPILKQVFDEFMAANPDVKLEVEVFSDLDIPVKGAALAGRTAVRSRSRRLRSWARAAAPGDERSAT